MSGVKSEVGDKMNLLHINLHTMLGGEIGKQHQVSVVPTSLLFNRQGTLIFRHDGVPNAKDLMEQLIAP